MLQLLEFIARGMTLILQPTTGLDVDEVQRSGFSGIGNSE